MLLLKYSYITKSGDVSECIPVTTFQTFVLFVLTLEETLSFTRASVTASCNKGFSVYRPKHINNGLNKQNA